jgi:hypothetical protein
MPTKMKDNPRRAELEDALRRASAISAEIPGVFTAATTAMSAKAWTGGTSGDFSGALSAHQDTARKGGSASVEEIQHAYDTTPDQVEDTST